MLDVDKIVRLANSFCSMLSLAVLNLIKTDLGFKGLGKPLLDPDQQLGRLQLGRLECVGVNLKNFVRRGRFGPWWRLHG